MAKLVIDAVKLLLVEDEETLMKMYQLKFVKMGWLVETAVNGEEALAKMRTFKPEVVLMDIMMPKMDGIAALKAAKADPDLKEIPIIMLTNLSKSDDTVEAMKDGAMNYLVKSDYTPSELAEKVKEILGK